MRKQGSRLKARIKLLTTISILSSILATIALILCGLLVYFIMNSSNIDQLDSNNDLQSNSTHPKIEENTSQLSLQQQDENNNIEIEPNTEAIESSLDQISYDIDNINEINGLKIINDIKSALSQGDSAVAIFRRLFPDDVVITSGNTYSLVPVDKTLKLNEKERDIDFDDPDLLKGIDVSVYQGDIDWEKVASTDIDFAIIRAGIRGYTEGGIIYDINFENNISSAVENGIPVGIYFFTQAISKEEAIEEAQFVLEAIKDYKVEWPIYLDVEDIGKSNGRTNSLSKKERTEYALAFVNEIKNAGYKAGLYGNLKTYISMLDMADLQDIDIWLAAYTQPIYFPYHYDTLQYSEKGNIDGIQQPVDINVSWKKY